jgi:phosphatidylinositol alpha 1,6-mannosyltransferase
VRVAIVAECFLPEVNGVTNSVLRVVEQLEALGHTTLVIAPGLGPAHYRSTPIERVPALGLPFYRSLPVGLPTGRIRSALRDFQPDVVHLAAPAVLGAAAARACRRLQVPSVAVYQTDLAGFAARYRLGWAGSMVWSWLRWIHESVDLTLAPSTQAAWELRSHGIGPVAVWARGVDADRFNPSHRSSLLRHRLAPRGEVLAGYVGRLAKEKQVHLLSHLRDLHRCRVVVVGDGPERLRLERRLPGAAFLGFCGGLRLSQAVASLDVFVHTGFDETFCQSIQEALASGVPVVAPASGGPLDLIQHGANGWLYPTAKPELIAAAVGTLVDSPPLRQAMGRRAALSVTGRSWAALADQLLGHYASVTGWSSSGRKAA